MQSATDSPGHHLSLVHYSGWVWSGLLLQGGDMTAMPSELPGELEKESCHPTQNRGITVFPLSQYPCLAPPSATRRSGRVPQDTVCVGPPYCNTVMQVLLPWLPLLPVGLPNKTQDRQTDFHLAGKLQAGADIRQTFGVTRYVDAGQKRRLKAAD